MGTGKGKSKPNGNIMSFFKKAESSGATVTGFKEEDEGLFIEESPVKGGAILPFQTPTPPWEEYSMETWPKDAEMDSVDSPLSRYNENIVSSKRRRTDDTPRQSPPVDLEKPAPTRGPFIDDSDSDDDQGKLPGLCTLEAISYENQWEPAVRHNTPANERQPSGKDSVGVAVPSLKREMTSIGEGNEFDGIDDFIDDEFPEEGEEYLERRWMEEQAEFEEGSEEDGQVMEDNTTDVELANPSDAIGIMPQDAKSSSCPICGGNTAGLSDQV